MIIDNLLNRHNENKSKLSKDVEHYLNLSQTNIKNLSNEQTKAST